MQTNSYRAWALAALVACALAAVPAANAGAESPASASVSAQAGVSVPEAAAPSVLNLNGAASELLGKLTIAQLLSLLNAAPEQLSSEISSALSDIVKDGGIAQLAHELALPPAAVEGAQFTSRTIEEVAGILGTSVGGLNSALPGAGAISSPLALASRVAAAPIERAGASGATLIVGTPTGAGGITLTVVNSTPSSAPGSSAAGFKANSPASVSNAFSILSVKVTKRGAILERVRLPGPGRLSVAASAPKHLARRSRNRHARLRTRTVKVASAAVSTHGGTLTITLHPRGLSRASRVRVTLATTYVPTGGSPRTLKRAVTISRRGSRRHS